jgi:hypothetical protein
MTLEEFEIQYREAIDTILNRLQTVTLLSNRVQIETAEIGDSIHNLNQLVETFLQKQSNESTEEQQ